MVENFVYNQLSLFFSEQNIHFYGTRAKSKIDFIANFGNKVIPIEAKFQKKASIPVSIKNFNKNYPDRSDYSIIVTLDKLDFQSNTHFIPVILFPFVRFDK